jgi:hypothetical protein
MKENKVWTVYDIELTCVDYKMSYDIGTVSLNDKHVPVCHCHSEVSSNNCLKMRVWVILESYYHVCKSPDIVIGNKSYACQISIICIQIISFFEKIFCLSEYVCLFSGLGLTSQQHRISHMTTFQLYL